MIGPITVLVTALVALPAFGAGASAPPCTAPTRACAETLPAVPAPMARSAQKAPKAHRAQFLRLHARTAACMRSRAADALHGNVREDAVNDFIVRNCADALHGWFTREDGLTEDQSFTLLDRMASDAIAAERAEAAPKAVKNPSPARMTSSTTPGRSSAAGSSAAPTPRRSPACARPRWRGSAAVSAAARN